MKGFFNLLLCGLSLAIGQSALAQTPDGTTPAEETVCSDLMDDDVTIGLYGLCVAYCEAHDAEGISPTGDLEALNPPNRSILESYNKMKTPSDPDMPCVQNECPCWDTDLFRNTRPPQVNEDVVFENACSNDPPFALIENHQYGAFTDGFQAYVFNNGALQSCFFGNYGDDPNLPVDSSQRVPFEQYEVCKTQLISQAQTYAADGTVWDCWPISP